MAGCGDVLSLADLETAKKHQVFEAEVITGKQGGVAGGASIDYATNQVTGQTQKTLPAVLRDAGLRPASFTFATGGTLAVGDSDVVVLWPISSGGDGQYYLWKGAYPKTIPAGSSPDTTGGVSDAGWLPWGDITLREELATTSGAGMLGTPSGRTVHQSLRKLSDYPSAIDALATGLDIVIDEDYNTAPAILPGSHQMLVGRGGEIKMDAINAAVHAYKKDDVRLKDLKIFSDKVIPSGAAAYGIKLEEGEGHSLDGLSADGFTGAVFALKTVAATVRNVFYKNGIYHPSFEAGGYAVLLDKTNETVVDGVQFYADATHGRHALYVSRTDTSDGSYDGCLNTVANNIVARYVDRDDRNMWTSVIRKSKRTVVNNLVTDGANGGIAILPKDGNVDSFILNNINAKIYQYQNGLPVYGVSHLSAAAPSTYRADCFIASNLILDIEAKDSSITGDGCIGYSVSGKNGLVSNVITNVTTLGTPFLIKEGVSNLIISDVVDVIDDGVVATPQPMFAFTGPENSISNITIRGIRTNRKMFDRIFAVKDMTVDYQRQLRVNLASGAATTTDPHELIERVIVGTAALDIVFKSHVTQAAIDGLVARMSMDPGIDGFVVVRATANKLVDIRFFSQTGVLQNPTTAPNLSVTVTLYS